MNDPIFRERHRRRCAREAAEWLLLLRAGDVTAETRKSFAAWLLGSVDHVNAYLRIAMLAHDMGSLPQLDQPGSDEMRAALTAGDSPPEAIPLFGGAAARPKDKPRRVEGRSPMGLSRRAVVALAAVMGTAAVGFGLLRMMYDRPTVHETAVGEQQSIVLDDGSTVLMNVRSRMAVDLDGRSRQIELLAGEAFFDVAEDPGRPFRVDVGDAVIEALGTAFAVRRREGVTVATLSHGVVAITSDAVDVPVRLRAPQQAVIDDWTGRIRVSTVDLASALAWRRQQLVFREEALADAAAEFNRYNARKLVLLDPRLESALVGGVFDATDPDSFALLLEETGLAEASHGSSRIVLTMPREKQLPPGARYQESP